MAKPLPGYVTGPELFWLSSERSAMHIVGWMNRYNIVPRPAHLTPRPGELVLSGDPTLACSGGAGEAGRLLRELLSSATGFEFPYADDATVRLVVDPSTGLAEEGYRLSVRPEGLEALASSPAGLRNCLQTLRQLLPAAIYRQGAVRGQSWAIPCVEIEDAPRFPWRGALVDVSRHFMPAGFLFRFVDLLAMHKLNVLHLHLTDDQGWRFPSSSYPLLTERGSWRRETLVGHEDSVRRGEVMFDGTPHGGYYTIEELTDLVSYAAERNVMVVPEVDFPGHVQSAIAAYPKLGCTGEPLEVRTTWGISDHVLNLSEMTMNFCAEVLREVAAVFPSPYFHVGGDECPRAEWRSTPAVQRRIAELGLANEDGLQAWFTARLNGVLRAEGRRLVAWDEVLESGTVLEDAVVMAWRDTAWAIKAMEAGLDTVVCPENPCYFDHYQSDDPDEPLAIHGLNTLESVYSFDPAQETRSSGAKGKVLGTQLSLWTVYTPGPRDVEYMAFPRAAALAEVAWSSGERSFSEFCSRLGHHIRRLDALSVNYRPLDGPLPWQRGGTGARKAYYGPSGRATPLRPAGSLAPS